jgi:hypothetical protein
MPQVLPDEAMLFLYKHIIMPWETGLKNEAGCWDVKRTRQALKRFDVQLQCVDSGQVEDAAEKQRASKQTNFIVFVSKKSQMKDLFKHFRNCAAHSSISTARARGRKTVYRFSGTEYRKPALAVSGELDLVCFREVIGALVTGAKPKLLLHSPSSLRASP